VLKFTEKIANNMNAVNSKTQLIEKIRTLPSDKITILEEFIDFLLTRSEENLLDSSSNKFSESEAAFSKIGDNPEETDCDRSQIKFLESYQKYGFKDANELVKKAIKLLELALEAEQLEESAALYAEIYAEDTELQELAESGLEEWPIE
jgi:hypothetical protein